MDRTTHIMTDYRHKYEEERKVQDWLRATKDNAG